MKNRLIVFGAQFVSNIVTIIYLRFTSKGMIPQTLASDFFLCVINFTILKKVIEDKDDKYLWMFYTFGSLCGTFLSMKIFEYFN
jgi:hypothetical protein